MAIRNDFTIDWTVSPRIIIVDAPSVEVTMQDLLDTLRWEESLAVNMSESPIVSASGKEPLGGGTLVGITVALLNAQIGFEARSGPDWEICDLSGGNLVAFDTDGVTTIVPLYPTAFVSIAKTSSSSATLQEQDALNYASYGGMVSVDITSGNAGVVYPVGNQEYPVNNIIDAISIANEKGFFTIGIRSSMTISSGVLDGFEIIGRSHINVALNVDSPALVSNVTFSDIDLSGVLDGGNDVRRCIINDLEYFNGHIHDSAFHGKITLSGTEEAYFNDCSQLHVETYPTINLGGTGQDLTVINYTGLLNLENCTGATTSIGIGLTAGRVILDTATMTAGFLHISGIGQLMDELGNIILSGSWNGMTIINELMHAKAIQDANIVQVNGINVDGAGTEGDPWGPI